MMRTEKSPDHCVNSDTPHLIERLRYAGQPKRVRHVPSLGRYPHGHVPSPIQITTSWGDAEASISTATGQDRHQKLGHPAMLRPRV